MVDLEALEEVLARGDTLGGFEAFFLRMQNAAEGVAVRGQLFAKLLRLLRFAVATRVGQKTEAAEERLSSRSSSHLRLLRGDAVRQMSSIAPNNRWLTPCL